MFVRGEFLETMRPHFHPSIGQHFVLTHEVILYAEDLVVFVGSAVVDVVENHGGIDSVGQKFSELSQIDEAVLLLPVNVNEVYGLHEDEKLFEVESCKLVVGHVLAENLVDGLVAEFLDGAFAVLGGPFQLVPVQLAGNELVFAHPHEHVVLVEDGNVGKQVKSVLVLVVVPRVVSQHTVEHVLLVVTEVYLRQHHLLRARFYFAHCYVLFVVRTHLPRDSRTS